MDLPPTFSISPKEKDRETVSKHSPRPRPLGYDDRITETTGTQSPARNPQLWLPDGWLFHHYRRANGDTDHRLLRLTDPASYFSWIRRYVTPKTHWYCYTRSFERFRSAPFCLEEQTAFDCSRRRCELFCPKCKRGVRIIVSEDVRTW